MKTSLKKSVEVDSKQSPLKKSPSTKVEHIRTAGSMNSQGTYPTSQSQNSESTLPDSSRKRDGRKRMKKTVSNKQYDNMQSQDVSKVDDSQQIHIDQSINKNQNQSSYTTLDFMSQNGLSQQQMNNDQSQVGPFMNQFKMQGAQSQSSIMQGINTQANKNNIGQQQNQLSQPSSNPMIGADAAQMPKRINKNQQVIDLSAGETEKSAPLSLKSKLLRGVFGIIFVIFLFTNIYMTFQPGILETGQLRGRKFEDGKTENGDEYYTHVNNSQKKEAEADMGILKRQLENCKIQKKDFIKQYSKKDQFFDVDSCQWTKSCDNFEQKVFSRFCVKECPQNSKNVSGVCQSQNKSNNNN